MNYFELYELPIRILVDTAELRRKYLSLSKQYHPDFFDDSGTLSSDDNLQMASMINEGYKILQNEYLTLGYILQIQQKIAKDEKYALSPEFLMDMMELNESYGEEMNAQISERKLAIKEPVLHLIKADTVAHFTDADYELLKAYYYQYKYLDRLMQRASEWERNDE